MPRQCSTDVAGSDDCGCHGDSSLYLTPQLTSRTHPTFPRASVTTRTPSRKRTPTRRSSHTRPSDRSPTITPRSSVLEKKPAIIGHSFGGLLVQMVAGRGLAAATVAIDPGPFRGVLPLPFSALKSATPVIGNPANHARAVPLTCEQFRYGFANAASEEEAHELYETFA